MNNFIEGLNKSEFTQGSYFILNNAVQKQNDGVAMGSPLGHTIANVFLLLYAAKWFAQCPK